MATRPERGPRGPTAPPEREKRALAALQGGPLVRSGDPELAALCVAALDVLRTDDPLELTHGFHSWPARFHPELPRRLLRAMPEARRVLDPFAGSGTTLVEAVCAGRAALGTDLNPLGVMLARLKAAPASEARRRALVESAAEIAERALEAGKAVRRSAVRAARSNAGRPRATRFDDPRCYPRHVYPELVTLRLAIDEAAPADATPDWISPWLREALLLVLSSIVVKVSLQRSDTDPRLIERKVARGAAARLFSVRASLLGDQLAAMARLIPAATPAPDVRAGDARHLDHVAAGSIDLVITSPPYFGTYDYAAHHERRFGWVGLAAAAIARFEQQEIGSRRGTTESETEAFVRWRADVDAYVGEIARVLAPGAMAFLLVGDSVVARRAIPGDGELRRAAAACGLEAVASASQRRIEPPRLVQGSAPAPYLPPRHEHLVALRKPR